ncbi:MAG: hypothetical protein ACRC20_13440 [Segniliparus sp.]|uniref:hypothetical protein n=1 Tax=Segniliparus sp. TaxID=2804064 RepID=UPI003F35C98C
MGKVMFFEGFEELPTSGAVRKPPLKKGKHRTPHERRDDRHGHGSNGSTQQDQRQHQHAGDGSRQNQTNQQQSGHHNSQHTDNRDQSNHYNDNRDHRQYNDNRDHSRHHTDNRDQSKHYDPNISIGTGGGDKNDGGRGNDDGDYDSGSGHNDDGDGYDGDDESPADDLNPDDGGGKTDYDRQTEHGKYKTGADVLTPTKSSVWGGDVDVLEVLYGYIKSRVANKGALNANGIQWNEEYDNIDKVKSWYESGKDINLAAIWDASKILLDAHGNYKAAQDELKSNMSSIESSWADNAQKAASERFDQDHQLTQENLTHLHSKATAVNDVGDDIVDALEQKRDAIGESATKLASDYIKNNNSDFDLRISSGIAVMQWKCPSFHKKSEHHGVDMRSDKSFDFDPSGKGVSAKDIAGYLKAKKGYEKDQSGLMDAAMDAVGDAVGAVWNEVKDIATNPEVVCGVIGGVAGSVLGPAGTVAGAALGASMGSAFEQKPANPQVESDEAGVRKLGQDAAGDLADMGVPKYAQYHAEEYHAASYVKSDLISCVQDIDLVCRYMNRMHDAFVDSVGQGYDTLKEALSGTDGDKYSNGTGGGGTGGGGTGGGGTGGGGTGGGGTGGGTPAASDLSSGGSDVGSGTGGSGGSGSGGGAGDIGKALGEVGKSLGEVGKSLGEAVSGLGSALGGALQGLMGSIGQIIQAATQAAQQQQQQDKDKDKDEKDKKDDEDKDEEDKQDGDEDGSDQEDKDGEAADDKKDKDGEHKPAGASPAGASLSSGPAASTQHAAPLAQASPTLATAPAGMGHAPAAASNDGAVHKQASNDHGDFEVQANVRQVGASAGGQGHLTGFE